MAIEKPEMLKSEYEMFEEYRVTKDISLRDEIVEHYMYIADILSRRFVNHGIEYDDIYQVACMGIIYAVERFDPNRGVKFATFATPTVLGEIRKYFRDKGNFIKIPRKLYEIFYKAERMKRASGDITMGELARILKLPKSVLEEAYEAGDHSFMKSLEYEAYADGGMNLSDFLGAEDDQFLMIENKDFLSYCLSKLTEKERKLIEYRYYQGKSQREIAQILGVSQMQISRLERNTLKKLRNLYFRD